MRLVVFLAAVAGATLFCSSAVAANRTLSVIVVRTSWDGLPLPSVEETQAAIEQVGELLRQDTYGVISIGKITVTDTIPVAKPAGSGCLTSAAEKSAANKVSGVDGYAVQIFLEPSEDACDFAGIATLGGPDIELNGEVFPSLVEHELGHTLGLDHVWKSACWPDRSTDPACRHEEYGDPYSVMGAGDGFDAPELAQLKLLKPKPAQNGAVTLRPLAAAPDALEVATGQGTFWFENHQPVGWDTPVPDALWSSPSGIAVHWDDGQKLWAIPAGGITPISLPDWYTAPDTTSFYFPDTLALGAAFTVPGIFSVTYTAGVDPASMQFQWLDTTPPAKPRVQSFRPRHAAISAVDKGSLVARYEIRLGSHVLQFTPSVGEDEFVFPHAFHGFAAISAVDNAGNRSAVTRVRVTSSGRVTPA